MVLAAILAGGIDKSVVKEESVILRAAFGRRLDHEPYKVCDYLFEEYKIYIAITTVLVMTGSQNRPVLADRMDVLNAENGEIQLNSLEII